jgi:hypothetical protein
MNFVEMDKFEDFAEVLGKNYGGILNMRSDNLMGVCTFYNKP